MFTPSHLEQMPLPFERLMSDLEMSIMQDVIRRIKINNEITRSADWQIFRLIQMGKSQDFIQEQIKQALRKSDEEMKKLYDNVIASGYSRDEELYKAVEKEFIPFKDNSELQQLVQSTIAQTRSEMVNITQSLGFAIEMNGKRVFTPMSQYYQKVLDEAVTAINSGTFDYNSMLKKTIQEMTKSGIRTVDYATGWSNRVEVASRRALMTGVAQVTGHINEQNAAKLGTDKYEVSWHSSARPEHQVWQGRVYTMKQLKEICGLGTGPGLCGWNCYHSYYPFIEGVSERMYTDDQLDQMNTEENKPKVYNGKEYTTYEATQRQRQLETLMRKQRQDIKLLKDGGAASKDIQTTQIKYREAMRQYSEFSEKMGLPQQKARVYMDSLGRVDPGGKLSTGLKDAAGHSIIKANRSSLHGAANSIVQVTLKNGGINRDYFGSDGKQLKQISNHNHGNAKMHPYGSNGEHAHDYIWDGNELIERPIRELSETERKDNGDIL